MPVKKVPNVRVFRFEPKATPEIVPALHVNAEPFQFRTWLEAVGAVMKFEIPALVWYAIRLAAPPARLVAVVALVAAPLKVAVMVPALKLPDASRATTLEAVLASVASTAKVRAAEPSNVPPEVRYVPAVRALATEPAEPAMLPDTAAPVMAMAVGVTLVTCPCAFVTNTGTEDAEPYVPAVPTLEMLNVVDGERFKPVPALYTCAEEICTNVSAVVPNVITPTVFSSYVSPAPVSPDVTKNASPCPRPFGFLTAYVSASVARVKTQFVPPGSGVPTVVTV